MAWQCMGLFMITLLLLAQLAPAPLFDVNIDIAVAIMVEMLGC
jgi:hypothetical protein